MIRYFLAISLTAYSLTAFSLTDAWSVDLQQHTAVQRTYKQGETWTMQISLRDGRSPVALTNATARLYWYTNATDNVWWTNAASVSGGTVTASWTPAMDTGAALYNYWVGIWPAGATSPLWRVMGTIRLLPSPGHTPNALTVPVRTLDFAAITLTNAPWVTSADWASGSNAFASALSNLSARLDSSTQSIASIQSTLPGLATTGALAAAIAAIPVADLTVTRWHDAADTNRWGQWDGGTNIVLIDRNVWAMTVSADWTFQGVPYAETGFGRWVIRTTPGVAQVFSRQSIDPETAAWDGNAVTQYTYAGGAVWIGSNTLENISGGSGTVTFAPTSASDPLWRYHLPTNPVPPELSSLDQLTAWLADRYATKAEVNAVIAAKELHYDSYTNLVWRSVISNGWHWLVPYTNTP